MKKHIVKSNMPFRYNFETLELESEATIKEGDLPIIPRIWIEEVRE